MNSLFIICTNQLQLAMIQAQCRVENSTKESQAKFEERANLPTNYKLQLRLNDDSAEGALELAPAEVGDYHFSLFNLLLSHLAVLRACLISI